MHPATEGAQPLPRSSCWRDNRGLSTVEYVIILVLIAAAAVGSWSLFGQTVQGKLKTGTLEFRRVSIE